MNKVHGTLHTMDLNSVQEKNERCSGEVQPVQGTMSTEERRAELRQRLLNAAERKLASDGFRALKARDLAAEAGCALGQIYNIYPDLDALIIAVNARTLDDLDERLLAAEGPVGLPAAEDARAVLVAQAEAYLDFARHNGNRWRAVFEHRLPRARAVPGWYREQQARLFSHVDRPLRALLPDLAPHERASLGRSIFSAVHGIVWLGLEELLGRQSYQDMRHQLGIVVRALIDGLSRSSE
jgi:AcrR family transcriptional regulator